MDEATPELAPPSAPKGMRAMATAEAGYVILDGLPGLTATLTPDAAMRIGQNLIDVAEEARRQR